jgi:hypothetical protein
VTATALLALCCCAAARTAGGCGIGGGGYGGDAATRAGKWLPYAGAVGGGYPHNHLPSAFWAQRPGDGAFEGGGGGQEEELVRLREQSYERGESERTKQEQLAIPPLPPLGGSRLTPFCPIEIRTCNWEITNTISFLSLYLGYYRFRQRI